MQKNAGHILLNPRITEKGAYMTERGCYVFAVAKDANKKEIADAIRATFKVTPRKIAVAAIPRKMVTTRGSNRKGHTASGKKAYVYLKKGDTIEVA